MAGGYDYEFLDPAPSDDQMCLICRLVAREACQANCCGKIFCKGCIQSHRYHSSEFNCPNCRKHLTKRYFQDTRINREISSLNVYCTTKSEGCSWQGNLKDIDTHIKECPNQVIKCPYHDIGCKTEMKREMMDQHVDTNTQAHLQNAVEKIREQQQTVIKFSDYSKHNRDKDHWYSSGFYTSAGGYKLNVLIDANGNDDGKGTHVSCYVYLMPGEYDDILE